MYGESVFRPIYVMHRAEYTYIYVYTNKNLSVNRKVEVGLIIRIDTQIHQIPQNIPVIILENELISRP